MNSTTTFETKQEIEKQDPLSFILEKQTKEFEDFSKRMSLEFQSSYQEYLKQQNGLKLRKLNPGLESECGACQCKEKDELINSLKVRIKELEKDSCNKNQDIKKLQEKVQSLFNIIVKKGIANSEEIEEIEEIDIMPTKITVTTELEEEIYDRESTKQINIAIEKDRLSVESTQYYDDDNKDSYSDSAVDMFTDDDSSTTTGYSIKTDSYEDNKYDRPSEWLDVASLKQRNKIDKKNLDRWNSKMANNGLLPIKLVGKVDEEKEKKIQTHRKRYSTSAIWLKTYENRQKQDQQSHDDKSKIPSFSFSKYTFNTTNDVKSKQKELKELPDPISLKSSVSTSVSDLYTTSVAATSLQPYELLEHHKNKTLRYSKSQQMLSQYK